MRIFNKHSNNTYLLDARASKSGYLPEVNKWELSRYIVEKLVPIVGYTPFPLDELMMLVESTYYFRPKRIYEWGTHVGKSARIFSETISYFDIKSHVYSIDLPENIEHIEHPHDQRGVMVKNKNKVSLLLGDGIATALNNEKKYNNHDNLLFFIDGDHSYGSVKRELSLITRKMPKAVIILHDTFYQYEKSGYNIGPYNAMLDTDRINTAYKRYDTSFGLPGMTMLVPNTKGRK